MKKIINLIVIALLLSSCFVGEETAPDQNIWEYALPSEVGMNDDLLINLDTILGLSDAPCSALELQLHTALGNP